MERKPPTTNEGLSTKKTEMPIGKGRGHGTPQTAQAAPQQLSNEKEAPAVSIPDSSNQPDTKPDATQQCNTKPDATQQCNTKPDTTQQCNTKPDTTQQCNTKPDTTRQCNTKPEYQEGDEPADPHAVPSWPDSWAETSWDSWGNHGWDTWSWGASWDSTKWDGSSKGTIDDHTGWRRRHSSVESLGDTSPSPSPLHRGWSCQSYQRSASLDSELLAGFNRLATIDRVNDSDIATVAQNLKSKLDGATTPEKPGAPTPTTATPQGSPSPSSSQQSSPGSGHKESQGVLAKAEDKSLQDAEKTEVKNAARNSEDKDAEAPEKEPETEETKAAKKVALAAERKKAAHARYLRYYRSVHGGDPRFYSMVQNVCFFQLCSDQYVS